jgi:hypothetical protein
MRSCPFEITITTSVIPQVPAFGLAVLKHLSVLSLDTRFSTIGLVALESFGLHALSGHLPLHIHYQRFDRRVEKTLGWLVGASRAVARVRDTFEGSDSSASFADQQ